MNKAGVCGASVYYVMSWPLSALQWWRANQNGCVCAAQIWGKKVLLLCNYWQPHRACKWHYLCTIRVSQQTPSVTPSVFPDKPHPSHHPCFPTSPICHTIPVSQQALSVTPSVFPNKPHPSHHPCFPTNPIRHTIRVSQQTPSVTPSVFPDKPHPSHHPCFQTNPIRHTIPVSQQTPSITPSLFPNKPHPSLGSSLLFFTSCLGFMLCCGKDWLLGYSSIIYNNYSHALWWQTCTCKVWCLYVNSLIKLSFLLL